MCTTFEQKHTRHGPEQYYGGDDNVTCLVPLLVGKEVLLKYLTQISTTTSSMRYEYSPLDRRTALREVS